MVIMILVGLMVADNEFALTKKFVLYVTRWSAETLI